MQTHTTASGWQQRLLPFAALLVAMVSVQFGAAFAKELFPALGVQRSTFLRLGLGALLLAPVLKPWRTRLSAREWPLLLGYSAAIGTMNLCFYSALQRIPLGIAVALEFTGPLGLALCLSHRRVDLLWVALAVAGLLLLLPLAPHSQALDHVGVAFALMAAVLWAAYSVLARRIGARHGNDIVGLAMAIAAVLILPVAALQPGPYSITPHLALAALVMALFASAVPFFFELVALRGMPVRVYGTFTSLEPALGTLMGLVVLRELPGAIELAGVTAIVIASVGSAAGSTGN